MTHATQAAESETSHRVPGTSRWPGRCGGVCFRSFVHRLANGVGLDGWVRNIDGYVMVAAVGPPATLDACVAGTRPNSPRGHRYPFINTGTVARAPRSSPTCRTARNAPLCERSPCARGAPPKRSPVTGAPTPSHSPAQPAPPAVLAGR
ncbi:acylphosphatase [Streptomyces sp. NBC_01003]|uniref:acylphosphatase n=1 Tax=Streptomyces sp. NBC_01003 TaxID=2903714 RepID=UPI0038658785|nr:acylphosphatase [Streptomyces sp. NBC_01003]